MELYDLLDIRSKKEVRHIGLSNWIMWVSLIKRRGVFFGKEHKFSLGHDPSNQDENQEIVTPKPREEVFPRRNE